MATPKAARPEMLDFFGQNFVLLVVESPS